MLLQYGISNPSSLTPVLHPEDAQPNEQTRKEKRPPVISSNSAPIRSSHGFQRGGYRGMYRGHSGPFTQYATRGNSARRGRGHDQGPSRGSIRPPIVNRAQQDRWSTQTSTVYGTSGHTTQTFGPAPISQYAVASRPQGSGSLPQTEPTEAKPPMPVIRNPILKLRVAEYETSQTRNMNRSPSPPRSTLPNRPNLPLKPQTHRPQEQSLSAVASSSNVHFAPPEPDFSTRYHQENKSGVEISVNRTMSSPKPETREPATPTLSTSLPMNLPAWRLRSRSPSLKLPPSPLKRRKLDHDYSTSTNLHEDKSDQVFEPIYAPTPPKKARNSIALPGRGPCLSRRSSEVIHVKKERLSPVRTVTEPGPSVKEEHSSPSPLPPTQPQRKLIKESVNFYPLPTACKKLTPEFARNRRAYFKEKEKELRNHGLTTKKAFWRDDGLVIEWSSSVPVWSDTLKPDIPDLAVAIQRAHELNEMKTPHGTPKRKRVGSTASQASNYSSPGVVEVTPKSIVSQKGPRDKKKARKHWADGIPLEDLGRATNLSSPSLVKPPQENTVKRPPLPTRLPAAKPASVAPNVVNPLHDPPDPVVVPPSQQWKALAKRNDASTSTSGPAPARMIFKPTNPRSHGATQEAHATTSTQDAVPGRQEPESAQTVSDGSSQVVGLGPHGMVLTITALSQLSPTTKTTTPRVVPTPESTRSPTLVNECLSTNIPHDQSLSSPANENHEDVSGRIPATANQVRSKTVDVDDEGDSDAVAMDLLCGTSGAEFTSSDSEGDSMDEETESTVRQFISKYTSMFDFNRRTLKKAYSKYALFSCRVHHAQPNSCATLFVPESKDSFRSTHSRASASQVIRGRTQICDKLLELGQYQFIPRGVPVNPMYTWSMPKLDGVPNGILLSLHGEVVKTEADPAMDHRLAVDQTFLLRQRSPEDDTDDDDGTDVPGQTSLKNFWPLAVVSHQMTVRSNPLLDTKDLHTCLPWIDDILH